MGYSTRDRRRFTGKKVIKAIILLPVLRFAIDEMASQATPSQVKTRGFEREGNLEGLEDDNR